MLDARRALRRASAIRPRELAYCGWTEQNPLMHRLVLSQQSALVVHFSCSCEQFVLGGAFVHTRPPSAPGSQYPLQH
jgi:hypothetical protein